jgi:hypothetical protein
MHSTDENIHNSYLDTVLLEFLNNWYSWLALFICFVR